ncbi:MAG: radical SAM protein [Clostridia bacterium]|nr:radical SAM protein [Clostridia bacterium]
MKKNVYFVQVDVSSGKDSKVVYLPYTSGVIIANAFADKQVASVYEFKEFIFLRKNIEDAVAEMENPAVVGFSNYVWNTEYHLALASEIKKRFPECITVFGGHNIPQSTDFLEEYAQVDCLCFGEGEVTFGALLNAIENNNIESTPNIAYRKNGKCFMGEIKPVCRPDYVSPYLNGMFDEVLKKYPHIEFNTILETSRGCPNSCAYCDWGPLKEKTRFFPLEKVLAEIDWIGRNKIRFVWGADANFGIGKNDLEIADALVAAKEKYSYPERVRINYSKGNSERVREIVRRFNRKGIDREGATLSLQSLSPVVLENIGRKNMSLDRLSKHFSVYHEEGLQVYSELILGLPGETYDSFADGICKLFEIGQHFIFEVYHCIVLPNSLLGQKDYMQKHGIKTSNSEIVRFHCTADAYYIPEKINIITETATMPCLDWQRSSLFAAFTQAMHACGLLRCFSVYAFHELKIGYRRFYEGLMDYIESGAAPYTNSLYQHVKASFAELAKGINPRFIAPHVGNLVWDHYEYMFLCISANIDKFLDEMMPYLRTVIEDENVLSQLADYQKATLRRPDETTAECETEYNFHEYFRNIYINKYSAPEKGRFRTVFTDSNPVSGWETFGKYVVWYGKMGSKSYKDTVNVEKLQ